MTAAAIVLTVLLVVVLLGQGTMFALSSRYEDLALGGFVMLVPVVLLLTLLAAELGHLA